MHSLLIYMDKPNEQAVKVGADTEDGQSLGLQIIESLTPIDRHKIVIKLVWDSNLLDIFNSWAWCWGHIFNRITWRKLV